MTFRAAVIALLLLVGVPAAYAQQTKLWKIHR